MNGTTDHDGLLDAVRDAGVAFFRLCEKGLERSDQDLARDQDYLRLHRSGMRIAVIGGEAAIHGAIQSISRLDNTEHHQATQALKRFWCGMGSWRH